MLAQLGYGSSASSVAKLYVDFTGVFVIDLQDKSQQKAIRALGIDVTILPTVMKTRAQKRKLARAILDLEKK
jgi:LPPG:FO 2-phospho-L-lactate transferase